MAAAPLGLPAAKHSRWMGMFLEFLSMRGLWMEGFSVHGLPKAHAASFAALSYAAAYMRTHHPAPHFAGLLNSQPMGFHSPRVLRGDGRARRQARVSFVVNRLGDLNEALERARSRANPRRRTKKARRAG